MRWRDPNLTEVIGFLNNPNNVIKANAAAYLQHLCYMDDPNKQKTRSLGGIPPLVMLLSHESPDVYRNACGALRYMFLINHWIGTRLIYVHMQGGARNVIPLIGHITHFYYYRSI